MDIVEYAEFLVRGIATKPELVKVSSFESDDDSIILEIIVHNTDMSLIIGRKGNTASSLRTLIQAFAYIKGLKKVKINIDSF